MSETKDVFGVPYGDTKKAFPDVFNKIPPQPTEKKDGQLTDAQVKQFFDEGFLVVDDYFDPATLEPCKAATKEYVDGFINYLYKAGQIKSKYEDYGHFQRLTHVEKELPGTTMLLAKAGFLPKAIKELWCNPRLLNAMEQLLGTRDIQGNPVWNLRNKVPQNEATVVPWHQDIGYMDNDSHGVMHATAWIPLLDTNAHNGCMEVVRKGHKTSKIVPHYSCWKSTHYVEIEEKEMEELLDVNLETDVVTCEVPYGGVLFLSNILPHRSVSNLSNDIRWSLDLRWQRLDQPVGFHGLKNGIQLCSASDPNFKVNWDEFDGGATLQSSLDTLSKNGTVFDPLIPGPWIRKWEIKNKNRHVQALEKKLQEPGEFKLVWHEKPTSP